MTALPQRQTTRLPAYDYARNGVYFVTICSHRRERVFGKIEDGWVVLNGAGRIVEEEWLLIPIMRSYIELDSYVIMPSHLHGILVFQDPWNVETNEQPADNKPRAFRRNPRSLGSVVAGVKAAVTRRVNQEFPNACKPLWQRNYYEHIVSSEAELERVREYINANPTYWSVDEFNLVIRGRDRRL